MTIGIQHLRMPGPRTGLESVRCAMNVPMADDRVLSAFHGPVPAFRAQMAERLGLDVKAIASLRGAGLPAAGTEAGAGSAAPRRVRRAPFAVSPHVIAAE